MHLHNSIYKMPHNIIEQSIFTQFCNLKLGLSPTKVTADIERWLEEDHGGGDCTIFSALSQNALVKFFIVAKHNFILAGQAILAQVFRIVSANDITLFSDYQDGDEIKKGDIILGGIATGSSVLLAERVALNLCARLSGIATKTRDILTEIRKFNSDIVLLETRKTTPGLRLYEKYATRLAGARNHRHALDTGALLKENHLRQIGDISLALSNLKNKLPILTKIEIEVTSLAELKIALQAQPDIIMLDNFSLADIALAVIERDDINRNIKLELSGNLDERDIAEIANSGVDYLSMGALIYKATWVDMSLQIFKFDS